MATADQKIVDQILHVTEVVEKRVEEEIDNLGNIEQVRERRLAQMKQNAEKNKKYLALGHGDYREIEERDVFRIIAKSSNVLLHFTNDSDNCKILDTHLTKLSEKHLECRFLKIDAVKSPFLCSRLRVTVLPTCLCIKGSKVIDRIIGFTELDNTNQFTTELLESNLIQKNLLEHSEDLDEVEVKRKLVQFLPKPLSGTVRSGATGGLDDEDW